MIEQTLPHSVLAILVFMMMGPLGVIPLFAGVTAGVDRPLRIRTAGTAIVTAAVALAVAVLVGASAMARVGTSPSSLIIAAGLVLTATAVRNLVFGGPARGSAGDPPVASPGISPIAVPGIVTPVGVAVVIIFATYFPQSRLEIAAVVGLVLVANFGAMLIADWFMRRIGMAPLLVLGSVFGVLQAAMGIQFLVSGLLRSGLWQ